MYREIISLNIVFSIALFLTEFPGIHIPVTDRKINLDRKEMYAECCTTGKG
jgi:hypothetical protein